jgi:predicted nucleic acid-binding protein
MKTDIFFDSNILLYLTSGEATKADLAEALIKAGGCVSVQVLNECSSVLRRKNGLEWPAIREFSETIMSACTVFAVTTEIHSKGLVIAERYKYRVHDSMLIAAALIHDCTTLYSEDMHNGQIIDGLTIRNPFAAAP